MPDDKRNDDNASEIIEQPVATVDTDYLLRELGRSIAGYFDREGLEKFLEFHLFKGREDNANGFVRVHSHDDSKDSVTNLTTTLFEESQRVRDELNALMRLLTVEQEVSFRVVISDDLRSNKTK